MNLDTDHGRPISVGALYSATGPTAYIERTQLNATLLAIDEINKAGGILGREVVATSYDARSDPARFSVLAERMLDEDKVSFLVGCYMSNTRQSVVPVVERRRALLAYAAPYEGFEYSPNVIYGGAVPNQHILLLARRLMKDVGKRFYLVGTRYTFPIECNRVMMTLVAERKGQILAERYVRLDAAHRELKLIAEDIKAKRPDVVFCTVVGEAARIFYEACREVGISEETQTASLTITEAELGQIGPSLAEGHLTAATYFESVDTHANTRFLRNYKAMFGPDEQTNAMAETAYGLTHMVLAAVARCGSADAERIRAELAATPFNAPQGQVRLDSDNSHFYLWPRIGRVTADGRFKIVEESSVAIKPDPYLINHTLADWDPVDVAAGAAPD